MHRLQLREGEPLRQQLETDIGIVRLVADPPVRVFHDRAMIEGQWRQFRHGKPCGVGRVGSGMQRLGVRRQRVIPSKRCGGRLKPA